MSGEPFGPTLAEASARIAAGESPVDLVEAALARIDVLEPRLHAFVTVTANRARAAAKRAETEIRAGRSRGPLHGVPYALKDIYDVEGIRTTAHSKLLVDSVARADSDATERLEAAGMILLGKLSTHEFARGGPTDVLPFPNARNPWNVEHFAGGSSSGSGVAVAAGIVGLAMGSDTGGSIRLPAAFCGTYGMKPTYGRLSRYGVVPLSFAMDHTGPLTRTAEDCALAMQVLAGHDRRDPASATAPVGDHLRHLKDGAAGLRIGAAREFNTEAGVGPEQQKAIDEACRVLASLGATLVDVTLPPSGLMQAVVWTIILAEGFAVHQQDLRLRPQDYGRVTRERLMVGAFVTGAQYVQAQRQRRLLAAQVQEVFGNVDAIVCANVAGPAPRVDEVDEGPWRREHPITAPFNGSGHPALSVPIGFSESGLPLSMQIVGAHFAEPTILRVAHAYEQATGWVARRPPL